ncbi:hypothetical protein GCM10010206_60360 [Streptomyces cinerochromogenes]|nr:hypothetical protein GCM10010206_60360 [Streptomyces cinerochromogenes]
MRQAVNVHVPGMAASFTAAAGNAVTRLSEGSLRCSQQRGGQPVHPGAWWTRPTCRIGNGDPRCGSSAPAVHVSLTDDLLFRLLPPATRVTHPENRSHQPFDLCFRGAHRVVALS